jgi:hypothetical protein
VPAFLCLDTPSYFPLPQIPPPVASTSPELERLSEVLAGQYRLERELGRGGMGVVLLARDLRLDRMVAIKTLPHHLADDAVIRERFLREARTAAQLSHPRIVPIHHAAEANGTVFFVMGLVDGGSVAQRVRDQGKLAPAYAIQILSDVAEALGYAHARGVIHRDVKAENILIDSVTGRAQVTDFGIARLAEAAPMTATGTVLGTVHYMSPEQVSGERVDGRSDLYALGVLAFLMLSGRFPFEHEAASAVLVAHVVSHAPSLGSMAPDVPGALVAIVDRLLRKIPTDRYATAEELLVALDRVVLNPPATHTPSAQGVLSSEEANRVWERAAMLQEMTGQVAPPPLPVRDRPTAQPLTGGYRMEDVVAAAEGVGIDRKYVDRALAERTPSSATVGISDGLVREGPSMFDKPNLWVGARTRLEYEAVVDGEIHPDDFEEFVVELRRSLGELGTASTVGRTMTFTSNAPTQAGTYPRRLQVTVTSRSGRTTIRAYEDIRQIANGIVGGVSGGVGGGFGGAMAGIIMGATQNPLIAVPTLLGIAGLAFGLSRFGVRRYSDKKARELREAVERLAKRVGEMTKESALSASAEVKRLRR